MSSKSIFFILLLRQIELEVTYLHILVDVMESCPTFMKICFYLCHRFGLRTCSDFEQLLFKPEHLHEPHLLQVSSLLM